MSDNAAVDRLNALVSKLVAAIRPPPNVSVSEWATQNRVLSPEASAEQGRWRNGRTPYLVEIMDFSHIAVSESFPYQPVKLQHSTLFDFLHGLIWI